MLQTACISDMAPTPTRIPPAFERLPARLGRKSEPCVAKANSLFRRESPMRLIAIRIGALYDVERKMSGRTPDQRRAVRQKLSAAKVAAFKVWAEQQLARIPGKDDLAKAFRYALNRWPSFTLFLEDGRVAIDNNSAERAMRPIGVDRRNWLFAGSDTGGETLARAMTLIESLSYAFRGASATSWSWSPPAVVGSVVAWSQKDRFRV